MPAVGARCHELRVQDEDQTWRLILRIDEDAVVRLEVFSKKNQKTPKATIDICKRRLELYDAAKKGT